MSNLKWKIYYDDGSRFTNLDGAWLDAPARGIIALNTKVEFVGRELDWGRDYYIWWPGSELPWGVDAAGLWDFLTEVGSELASIKLENDAFDQLVSMGVKFGRTIHTPNFRRIINQIADDPELPPKTARTRKEQQVEREFPDE